MIALKIRNLNMTTKDNLTLKVLKISTRCGQVRNKKITKLIWKIPSKLDFLFCYRKEQIDYFLPCLFSYTCVDQRCITKVVRTSMSSPGGSLTLDLLLNQF